MHITPPTQLEKSLNARCTSKQTITYATKKTHELPGELANTKITASVELLSKQRK